MTDSSIKPPVLFWIVGVLGLIWNGMGVNQYLGQAYQTDSWKSLMTPEQIELAQNLPVWYTACFALAVFGGVLGCIALLFRKKWAYLLFLLSLISVIIQMSYVTFSLKMSDLMTPIIIIVALFLLWYSKKSIGKGWIS